MSTRTDLIRSLREKLKGAVGYVFEIAAVLFFLGFFAAILIQVFTRYVVHYPLQWTEEFARILCVGMVSIAAAAAVDEHSRLKLGINFVQKHSFICYKILTLFIDVTSLIVLYYIAVGSYNRTVHGWTMFLPATGLKWGYLYLPLLVGSSMLVVYTLLNILLTIFELRHGEAGSN